MNTFTQNEINQDMAKFDEALESMGFMDNVFTDVTEGYVGRTPETKTIEHEFGILCKKYKNAGLIDISTADINGTMEMRNIEKALEKLTGFRKVDIIVFNTKENNAYTVPGSCLVRAISNDMPSMPTDHGKRYYDHKHEYYCHIVFAAELFTYLEADEMTAILLHEVGHNFDHTLTNWIFDILNWIITLPTGPLNVIFNIYRTEIAFVGNIILKILDLIPLVPILQNLGISALRAFDMLLGPLGVSTAIYRKLHYLASNPGATLGAVLSAGQVHKETFADSYVNAMGYGDAMIHAIHKMDTHDYITEHGPIIEFWTGAGSAASAMIMMFLDPHPENQTRARLLLDDMERLSKDKSVPRHMRKSISEQHKRCHKAYVEFLKADPAERDAVCTRFSRNLKESLFGGKVDFRILLLNLLGGTRATVSRNSYY